MRAKAVIGFISILVLAALVATGCGGPKDTKAAMIAACERQISEAHADDGATPTAKSTKDADEAEHLVECAGQPPLAKGGGAAEGEEGGEGEGADDSEGGLDEATMVAARDAFSESCAGCHGLADAAGTGGLPLDGTSSDVESMTAQIADGGGGMPGGLLDGKEVDPAQMAAYIAQVREG